MKSEKLNNECLGINLRHSIDSAHHMHVCLPNLIKS